MRNTWSDRWVRKHLFSQLGALQYSSTTVDCRPSQHTPVLQNWKRITEVLSTVVCSTPESGVQEPRTSIVLQSGNDFIVCMHILKCRSWFQEWHGRNVGISSSWLRLCSERGGQEVLYVMPRCLLCKQGISLLYAVFRSNCKGICANLSAKELLTFMRNIMIKNVSTEV